MSLSQDVFNGGDATTGDHRFVGLIAHPAQQVEIGTAKHAVGGYVGDDEPSTTGTVQPMQRLEEIAALPGPTASGELAPLTSSPMATDPCSGR